MTSHQTTIAKAFSACSAKLKIIPMLCFHTKSQKANMRTVKDIKAFDGDEAHPL